MQMYLNHLKYYHQQKKLNRFIMKNKVNTSIDDRINRCQNSVPQSSSVKPPIKPNSTYEEKSIPKSPNTPPPTKK